MSRTSTDNSRSENRWPTRIEFDEQGEATSQDLDDYFAGYDTPRDASDLDPARDATGPNPESVQARDGKFYPVNALRVIFETVTDPDDWKAPIYALIPADAYTAVDAAVEFYTATRIRVIAGPEIGTGRILIAATGYRDGPAGDH